ncbi:hypothetical protein HUT19_20845 [Streptomyces sp. NA02950]|nr:hypothetical protein [Streptomyces sp. NA02950]QKV93906.1 hypothetical protein HUT19_20845 [Streptomyces sp. NA02950]
MTGDKVGVVQANGTVLRGGRMTGDKVGTIENMTDIQKAGGAALLLLLS